MAESKFPGEFAGQPMNQKTLRGLAQKLETASNEVSNFAWTQTFVCETLLFSVLSAEDEAHIRAHADRGAIPLSKVSTIQVSFDPSVLESPHAAYGPSSVSPLDVLAFTSEPRSKFLVVRPGSAVPGFEELQNQARASLKATRTMGAKPTTRLVWDHSYVDDAGTVYEVILAPNEESVRKYSRLAGFNQASLITRITAVINPSTAGAETEAWHTI